MHRSDYAYRIVIFTRFQITMFNFEGFQNNKKLLIVIAFVRYVCHLCFELQTFHTLKRWSAQTTQCARVFSQNSLHKAWWLLIKHAEQSMPVWRVQSVAGSEYKVKLSSALSNEESFRQHTPRIGGFTHFMHTILKKVVPDNLKAYPRFVGRSNNQSMQRGFQVLKYHC